MQAFLKYRDEEDELEERHVKDGKVATAPVEVELAVDESFLTDGELWLHLDPLAVLTLRLSA